MNLNDGFDTGNVIAELANDIWQQRHRLVTNLGPAYLPYRISISGTPKTVDGKPSPLLDGRDDDDIRGDTVDINFYVHFVMVSDRWWYTINDSMPFETDQATLIFDDREELDYLVQGTSWRHYAFTDLLAKAVRHKVDTIMAGLNEPGKPYLWNTFPLENFKE
jgi:hypothetical protein